MNQKTSNGTTLLDATKAAVEHFIKCRNRHIISQQQLTQQQQQNPNAQNITSPLLPIHIQQTFYQDRYFLVSCEENLFTAIKVGWKDNYLSFSNALKNLQAFDMSNMGVALRRSFDLLNQFRLQTNVDNYGMGRYPFVIEPAAVIVFTDGTDFSSVVNGWSDSLVLPSNNSFNGLSSGGASVNFGNFQGIPTTSSQYYSELTKEPFRWDQRMYSAVMRFSNSNTTATLSIPTSTSNSSLKKAPVTNKLAPLCEATGGVSRIVDNMKQLLGFMEELANSYVSLPSVIVNLDQVLPPNPLNPSPQLPPNAPQVTSLHVPLYIKQNAGFWPIPESDLITPTVKVLPIRHAQPTMHVALQEVDLPIPEKFPVDRYELDPNCPMCQYILNFYKNQKPVNNLKGFKVYVLNSKGQGAIGDAFGFLRYQAPGSVFLYILPYNFPKLFQLMDELIVKYKMMPNVQWRQDFDAYMQSIPSYYVTQVKNALKRYHQIPNTIFSDATNQEPLSFPIQTYLKKLKKQQKVDSDYFAQTAGTKPIPSVVAKDIALPLFNNKGAYSLTSTNSDFRKLLNNLGNKTELNITSANVVFDDLTNAAVNSPTSTLPQQNRDVCSLLGGPSMVPKFTPQFFASKDGIAPKVVPAANIISNPFDIPRSQLLSQLMAMRLALYGKEGHTNESGEDIKKHSVPISQMGNYETVIMKKEVLRDPFSDADLSEWQRKRPNFGSPYARKKSTRNKNKQLNFLAVDEAEVMRSAGESEADKIKAAQERKKLAEEKSKAGETSAAALTTVASAVPSAVTADKANTVTTDKSKLATPFDVVPATAKASPTAIIPPQSPPSSSVATPVAAPSISQKPPLPPTVTPVPAVALKQPKKRTKPVVQKIDTSNAELEEKPAKKLKPDSSSPATSLSPNQQSYTLEEQTVLKELSTIPMIDKFSEEMIQEMYSKLILQKFEDKNAPIRQEFTKLLKQPTVVLKKQLEQNITQILDRIKGPTLVKQLVIKQLMQKAKGFQRETIVVLVQKYCKEKEIDL